MQTSLQKTEQKNESRRVIEIGALGQMAFAAIYERD
jgi:hypothetical protein